MKAKGFTLLEALLTLTILVSLVLLSGISFSSFISKNEEQVIIDEIKAMIQYAKLQAFQLDRPLFLSPLDADLNWSYGAVLSQFNKKTAHMEVIYQWQWHHSHWQISWFGVNLGSKITFSNTLQHAISNGQFKLVNMRTSEHTKLFLNRLGRVRVD